MFGHDSEFDIAQSGGGLKGIGGSEMPMPDRQGKGEGGPSKRKPYMKKNRFSPSMAHRMSDSREQTFSHQSKTPKLPGEDAINAPTKPGTGPSLFPQGNFKKRGLGSIGPV